jgi:hypothetical protein
METGWGGHSLVERHHPKETGESAPSFRKPATFEFIITYSGIIFTVSDAGSERCQLTVTLLITTHSTIGTEEHITYIISGHACAKISAAFSPPYLANFIKIMPSFPHPSTVVRRRIKVQCATPIAR